MSFARSRKLLLFALIAGVSYWLYKTRPTISGFVDRVTEPVFRSKTVVEESEHTRTENEAAPAVGGDQPIAIGTLSEKMTFSQVRELIGSPDAVETFQEDGVERVRWTYRRLGRVLVFQDGRVRSIAVR